MNKSPKHVPSRQLSQRVYARGLELADDVWDLLETSLPRLDTDEPNEAEGGAYRSLACRALF